MYLGLLIQLHSCKNVNKLTYLLTYSHTYYDVNVSFDAVKCDI